MRRFAVSAFFFSACASGALPAGSKLKDALVEEGLMLDAGSIAGDAQPAADAEAIDSGEEDAAPASEDASVLPDASEPADAEPAPDAAESESDSGVELCPLGPIFFEDFESYASGDMLGASWPTSVTGTGEARINLDAEGEGAAGSARYLIMLESGTSSNLWFATPTINLSHCAGRLITIDARLVPFGLAASAERLRIESSADGVSFSDLGTVFPGTAFMENACAPGSQSAQPSCVPWGSFSYTIPMSAFAAGMRVGVRLVGDGTGAVGIDDFSITVR